MLDQHGLLICGTMSNLFIVDRGRLRTPELTGCGVNGIMRRLILATAEQQNIDFEICRLTPEMAMGASEMFLCNSQVGIWPVARCESSRFDDWPLTTRLRQILRASGVREGPQ
jgi:4-amino-4-deoxychorismate lyase